MSLVVRAYNVLFGDCILVSWGERDRTHHAWIDFGNFPGDRDTSFETVYDDVLRRTGGQLDLVIITHRHLDHLDGFHSLRQRFHNDFDIARLWYAHVRPETDSLLDQAGRAVANLAPNSELDDSELAVTYQNNFGLDTGPDPGTAAQRMSRIIDELGADEVFAVDRESDVTAISPPGVERMDIRVLAPERDSSEYLTPAMVGLAGVGVAGPDGPAWQVAKDPLFPTCAEPPVPFPQSELRKISDFARLRRMVRRPNAEVLATVDRTRNNTSLVTRWTYRRDDGDPISLLFAGDAEALSWQIMTRNAEQNPDLGLAANFVKVANHGGVDASPARSFAAVFPGRGDHRVLISTDPRRFTGVNQVPNLDVVNGWRAKLRRSYQLRQTHERAEGEAVVFRLD